jgi:hypothetical protein
MSSRDLLEGEEEGEEEEEGGEEGGPLDSELELGWFDVKPEGWTLLEGLLNGS